MTPQLTARSRLTLLYTGLFFITGVLLLSLNFALIHHRLEAHNADLRVGIAVPKSAGDVAQAGKVAKLDPQTRLAMEEFSRSTKQAAVREAERGILQQSAVALGLSTLLAAGLGWLVAGRVLRPVHQMSRAARRLSERNLHERVDVTGPEDEFRELAVTINGMLDRLEHAFTAQRHFVANASHELRTPVTTVRAMVQVAAAAPDAGPDLRRLAPRLLDVLGRNEEILTGLLELSRSEHGVERLEPVNLAEVAEEAIESVRAEVAERGLRWHLSLEPAVVQGDPTLLELLVGNLVRNAVRHNLPDGHVWVRTGEDGGGGDLAVENTGGALTDERLRDLVEPFRRGSRDRVRSPRGVGLGLPIVRAVARAHGADLEVHPRPGGGLRVAVRFTAGTPQRSDSSGSVAGASSGAASGAASEASSAYAAACSVNNSA